MPAGYERGVTSSSVEVGDIVIGFDRSLSTSGVTVDEVISRDGYDDGEIIVYIVKESGSLDLSNSANVIHTGRSKGIDVKYSAETSKQGSGSTGRWANVDKGDIIIGWDEDSHGDDFFYDLDADKDLYSRYSQDSTIYHNVLQARYDNTDLFRDNTCCIEGDAVSIEIETESPPTDLSAKSQPDVSVDLSWDCSLDPDAFYLRRRREDKGVQHEINIPGSDRTYSDTEVSSGFKYYYEILSTQVSMSEVSNQIDQFDDKDVEVGDLIAVFDTPEPTGVSMTKILDEDIQLYLTDDSGTLSVDSDSDVDVIHTSLDDTNSVDDYSVAYSSVGSSTEVLESNMSQGGLILQWDDGTNGDSDGEYWDFTGEEDNLYALSNSSSARRVNQVITDGDLSREKSEDVYLASVEITLSPTSGLDKSLSDASEDSTYVGAPHDPVF